MIFVTVGSDVPFDRLIRAVDEWAGSRGRADIFAQIGKSEYRPRHLKFASFLSPAEFADRMREASHIIAHAGMGTILSALQFGKPILVMPRRGHLGETRNDHQYAGAIRLAEAEKVAVALDESALVLALDRLEHLTAAQRISDSASPELLAALRDFIQEGEK